MVSNKKIKDKNTTTVQDIDKYNISTYISCALVEFSAFCPLVDLWELALCTGHRLECFYHTQFVFPFFQEPQDQFQTLFLNSYYYMMKMMLMRWWMIDLNTWQINDNKNYRSE